MLHFAMRPRSVGVVPVSRQDVVVSTVASGRVEGRGRVQVSSVQSGQVVEVAVDEGKRVAKGDLLVRLDDRIETAAVAQARASLAQAQAKLAEVAEVSHARAKAALASAEAELRRAEADLTRTRELLKQQAVSQAALEAAETAAALARAHRDAAQVDVTATAPKGALRRLARSAVEQAQAALASAEARLAQTRVEALIDGTVIDRSVEPGDIATPGRALLTLSRAGSDGGLEIVTTPDERNLAVLAVGQQAKVVADAFPDAPFDATVTEISPLVDVGRGTVELRLAIADPPPFLREDMTVSVEIQTGVRRNALVLPIEAVRELASPAPWALLVDGGRARRAPLELGARGVGVVEVLKGLREGEVVIRDADVKPGSRVAP